ncbi:MAG: phosphoribosylanthranilate isomerase, partial [Candidatus Omnitrophica bacterium]|nr:phosphoribosylanthranilate isomerase [Candidatus Omnitrophota bacterium]
MVKVKICGITNKGDAVQAAGAGCDALGFLFYRKSPRYIQPERVRDIVSVLPATVKTVGVFVNAREKTIRKVVSLCKLDFVQLHGEESAEFCERLKDLRVIKTFRVKDTIDAVRLKQYKSCFAFLFDTYVPSQPGGTGKTFNWELVRHLHGIDKPIFISGGLSCKNVTKAVSLSHPDWVDASSSLEIKPGKKN